MLQKIQELSGRLAGVVVVVVAAACVPKPATASQWTATVGAQTADLAHTVLAYLPNEIWIHPGDSIRFSFVTDELHTVSFLKPGQPRPAAFSNFGVNGGVFIGCPGTTPDGSIEDGTACVSSAIGGPGQSYTVNFPTPGNFKLVCLVHTRMTGAVHVLPLSETLPHDQAFYDRQANTEREALLSEAESLNGNNGENNQSSSEVIAGRSSIHSNGGGSQTVSVMRFFNPLIVVRVGDTVEWTNTSTPVFHTVTFGTEPFNDAPPSQGVTLDSDGARHAVISSPNQSVNSGFIGIPNQETPGTAEAPLDTTRFRVTFTVPGTFNYICGLHDNLGMRGTVIVHQ